ncbi:MAG: orotidine-5'-phosphate decarboxylase [bacterium]|nr:orotidine-5'-phosphate decarboxylase [bacterium]
MAELIVSLDINNRKDIEKLIEMLGSSVEHYKIGPVPLLTFGTEIMEFLSNKKKKIFLDLKFFDIPNTVENAVYSACKLNPHLLTVHTLGGKNMLKAAISGRNRAGGDTKIIGVTLLTSFSQEDLENIGIKGNIDECILQLAEISFECGLDGIVCSARELEFLRKKFPSDFLMVCPGIRPGGNRFDDQKRSATVSQAVRNGADYLVIGRPIIESENPVAVVSQIKTEIKENEPKRENP